MKLNAIKSITRALVAGVLLAAAGLSAAEDFPARAVRIVVPFGAGGVNDVIGRVLAEGLGRKLGVPVIIDNKPGAGSVLGADMVAHAAPDGYTLLMGSNTAFTVNPNLQRNLPYDAQRDFAVVSPLFTVPIVLLAKPDFPANTLDEFVAIAKKEPGKLAYGSYGQGSSSHLVMEWLKTRAGIELTHVPYKGGAAATTALLGGEVPVSYDALTGALPQIKAGKLKAISIMQNAKSTVAPAIPTTQASKYADIDLLAWAGIFAPAATPKDRLQKLGQAIQDILQEPQFVARLADFGADPDKVSAADLAARVKSESARLAGVIRDAKITLE